MWLDHRDAIIVAETFGTVVVMQPFATGASIVTEYFYVQVASLALFATATGMCIYV